MLLHTGLAKNAVLTEIRDEIKQFVLYNRRCMREASRKEEDDRQKERLAEGRTEKREDERKRKRDERENENHPPAKLKSVFGEVKHNKKRNW